MSNEKIAWEELERRLKDASLRNINIELADTKRNQLGRANRSNKIRTYNEKTGMVINHINNKKITFRELYKGNIDKIH
jgi:protein subunit release factor A